MQTIKTEVLSIVLSVLLMATVAMPFTVHAEGDFDMGGFDGGFDMGGYDYDGFDMGGYDNDGFDMGGYDNDGFDMGGYNDGGYDMGGYDDNGFDMGGYEDDGYDMAGYDQDDYCDCDYDGDGYVEGEEYQEYYGGGSQGGGQGGGMPKFSMPSFGGGGGQSFSYPKSYGFPQTPTTFHAPSYRAPTYPAPTYPAPQYPVYTPPAPPVTNNNCVNNSCNVTNTNINNVTNTNTNTNTNIDNSINNSVLNSGTIAHSNLATGIDNIATVYPIEQAPVHYPVQYIQPHVIQPQVIHQKPYCTITITNYSGGAYGAYGQNQLATITWTSSYATSGYISPSVGTVSGYGTMQVYPTNGQIYSMTVYGQGGTAYCSTQPYYVAPVVTYQNPTPYVSLSQIPYTGLELGALGNALYWLTMVGFAAAAAYLVLYFNGGVAATLGLRKQTQVALPKISISHPATKHVATSTHAEHGAHAVLSPIQLETSRPVDTMQVSVKEGETPRIVINRA